MITAAELLQSRSWRPFTPIFRECIHMNETSAGRGGPKSKRVSLSPLKFDNAIGGLLAVNPKKKSAAKKKADKRKKR